MTVTTSEQAASATGSRPFTIHVPEADLEALRARLWATRWPDRETVDDRSQGVQLGRAGLRQPRRLERGRPGGHFAAWEQPQLFSEEVRAAFRWLRR